MTNFAFMNAKFSSDLLLFQIRAVVTFSGPLFDPFPFSFSFFFFLLSCFPLHLVGLNPGALPGAS